MSISTQGNTLPQPTVSDLLAAMAVALRDFPGGDSFNIGRAIMALEQKYNQGFQAGYQAAQSQHRPQGV